MKKIIGLIVLITTILLFVTKSLYLEWTEFLIITASLSAISIIVNKQQNRISVILVSSFVIGFLFFWIFGLIDLIADHVMFFRTTGNEDGIPLNLGIKITEFSDDLFVASLKSMLMVLTISIILILILKLSGNSKRIDA